jgi:hypothetical protein
MKRRMRFVFARQGDVAWQGLVRSGSFRDTSAGPFGAFMETCSGGPGIQLANSHAGRSENPQDPLYSRGVAHPTPSHLSLFRT